MPKQVDCCPGCGSASISIRSTSSETGPAADDGYVCSDCNAWFGDPDSRQAHSNQPGLSALGAKLAAADPDAVGGEFDD